MSLRGVVFCMIVAVLCEDRNPCPGHLTVNFGEKCFGFFEMPTDLDIIKAQSHCTDFDGDLVSITSPEENEFIISKSVESFGDTYEFFIGMFCLEGILRWLDESPVEYINFDETLNDSSCTDDMHFKITSQNFHWIIAEKGMTTKTIVCSHHTDCHSCVSPTDLSPDKHTDLILIIVIASILSVILVSTAIVCIIVAIYRRRNRKNKREKRTMESMIENLRNDSLRYRNFSTRISDNSDEWEVSRRIVKVQHASKLGHGAFGSVFAGAIKVEHLPTTGRKPLIGKTPPKNDTETVAVKMLHVNMLCCVTNSEPTMLIVEYCEHGDLLSYMRERRKFMLSTDEPMSSIDRSKIITQKQQLMFCIQIAYGLEYLSHRGFVHRDIAARNIMVDQSESCKIGDFGLCREVARGAEHYHSRGGWLPIKWMSPEAIEHYKFSVASDVWSFGVLLFEIITLGGNPYPDWPAAEIFTNLKDGKRMERPDNCSHQMFTLMNTCWQLQPSSRPSFADLRIRIGKALEEASEDDYYLKLDAQANYYRHSADIQVDVIETPEPIVV